MQICYICRLGFALVFCETCQALEYTFFMNFIDCEMSSKIWKLVTILHF